MPVPPQCRQRSPNQSLLAGDEQTNSIVELICELSSGGMVMNVSKLGQCFATTLLASAMSASSALAGSVAPCEWVTLAQVRAAMGVDMNAGTPISDTGCSWHGSAERVDVTLSFQLASKWWAAIKAPIVPYVKTPVSGIGDEAIYIKGGNLVWLSVKKGDRILNVKVYGVNDEAKQKTIEKALAQAALPKF
jgi:hypothetical protein